MVAVVIVAADVRLIHFHNAHQLAEFFVRQASADAVAHVPSGFVRAEAHLRWICRALMPFLLVSIRWITRNQSRRGLFVFSKMVPAITEKR